MEDPIGNGDFEREIEVSEGRVIRIWQSTCCVEGGVVWDSSLVACGLFRRRASSWHGRRVLELGAGTGVCSLALAVLGAHVLATDLVGQLDLIRRNRDENHAVINAGEVNIAALDWAEPLSPDLITATFDVVLLVDCLYYTSVISPYILQ
jgi:predicted nicotinamide N-methyase